MIGGRHQVSRAEAEFRSLRYHGKRHPTSVLAGENAMADDKIVAFCTCPDEATASRLAHLLVREKAAACVNILAGVRSIYAWQGSVTDDAEILLLIKTRTGVFDRLNQLIAQHHPYETPELVALPIVAGADPYMAWLDEALA